MTEPRQLTIQDARLLNEPFRLERDELDGVDFLPKRAGRLDLDFLERFDAARSNQVWDGDFYQHALALHDRVVERTPMYQEHARVRAAVAAYLRSTVAPFARRTYHAHAEAEYIELARKLEDARPWGTYGHDMSDGSLVLDWCDRAGLVKLCPDDAREEGMRAGTLYGERIDDLRSDELEVRYAVFTWPNVPRWHLHAGVDGLFRAFRARIIYSRVDGRMARRVDDPKRVFPELVGAVASLEAPLSARGDWNIHLNVLMVFRERPDYRKFRQAWGANVEFRKVPAGATRAATREVFKYALKAVTGKSEQKARSGQSSAPPLIEWPPDAFDEWWRAHKGLRRTRSWGELYARKLPDLPKRDMELTEYVGTIKVTPAVVSVERPKRLRPYPVPDWAWDQLSGRDALTALRPSSLDLIQGNKFAREFRPPRLDSS